MTDITKISDADLTRLYNQPSGVAAMSDDELVAAYRAGGQSDGGLRAPLDQGIILPLSRDPATGKTGFDSNAGILGLAKRVFTLPDRVRRGEIDPMSDEGFGAVLEAGASMTPVGPVARMGGHGVRKVVRDAVAPPSAQALKAAAKEGYNAVRTAGVDYSAKAGADLALKIATELEADGILPVLAPKAHAVLKSLGEPPPNAVLPISGLDAARKALRNVTKDRTNPVEQAAAERAISQLDEFILAADPQSIVAGAAAAKGAAKSLKDARGNYAAAKRSERLAGSDDTAALTGVADTAQARAAATGSGANIDNLIRQRIVTLLSNKKARAGFTEAELAQLGKIAEGVLGANAARRIGNMLGGGGGLGAAVSMGLAGVAGATAAGGPMGAALAPAGPAIGAGIKSLENTLTKRALRKADEATRARSPLHEQAQANAPALSQSRKAAILKLLTVLTGENVASTALVD